MIDIKSIINQFPEIEYFNINSTDIEDIKRYFSELDNIGMVIYDLYSKRKYKLFGEKKYYLIMGVPDEDEVSYQKEIEIAIKEEDYERAQELKEEKESIINEVLKKV